MNEPGRKSRELWEAVFQEDTALFLDYYDRCVADHNEILLQEEEGRAVSMLHLNPYEICMGEAGAKVHYIVAVATREEYRYQGRMRRLLIQALEEMYRQGDPFTFLMPASEEIYLPFDFRTVSMQGMVSFGARRKGEALSCRPCESRELGMLAEYSAAYLKRHAGVYARRTLSYFQRMEQEQEAVNGRILLFFRGEDLAGYCFTGCEDYAEAWEIAVEPELYGEAISALTGWFADRGELPVKISGFLPGKEIPGIPLREISYRPMTMVRIVNLEEFTRRLRSKRPVSFQLQVEDPILSQNCGWFRFEVTSEGGKLIRLEEANGERISIAELGECFFGTGRARQIPEDALEPLWPVFFNELV